jgi:putative ABC transport system permease protein
MLSIQELITATSIGLIYCILAIGIYLTFRIINFPDLTCDGSFTFGAAISAVMIKSGCDPWICVIASAIVGGAAGLLTGALNVWLKIEDLLAGIIVAFMLYSVNLRIMGVNPNITLLDDRTIFSGDGDALATIGIFVFALAAVVAYFLSTDFGLGLRSVGQNRTFASACGVNTNAMVLIGLTVSNALVGICGAIFSQYQGFCDVSQGVGSLVVGLASVIVGERLLAFRNIAWEIVACVVGSVTYRIFIAFAVNSDIFGLRTQDLNLITGLMMIAIMVRKKCCR